jgi:hypothetical protein
MTELRKMRLAGNVVRIGRRAYRILVSKSEERRALGRPKRRWAGWGDVGWIDLDQDKDR